MLIFSKLPPVKFSYWFFFFSSGTNEIKSAFMFIDYAYKLMEKHKFFYKNRKTQLRNWMKFLNSIICIFMHSKLSFFTSNNVIYICLSCLKLYMPKQIDNTNKSSDNYLCSEALQFISSRKLLPYSNWNFICPHFLKLLGYSNKNPSKKYLSDFGCGGNLGI